MAASASSVYVGRSDPVDLDGTIGAAFIGLVLSALSVHDHSRYSWGSERFGLGFSGSRTSKCTSTIFSTPRIGLCTRSRSVPHLNSRVIFLSRPSTGRGVVVSRSSLGLARDLNKSVYRLLDGVNLAFTIHAIYHYTILNFGKYDQLDFVVWSFKVRFSCGGSVL